jgi:hypothetical protein
MSTHESILKQARRNHTALLSAFGKIGQERIADLVGCSGSTLSVFKSEHLERLCAVLAACGLKAVPLNEESISNDEIWALRVLANKRLEDGRKESSDSGYGSL